jgi:hypothetical protein
MRARKPHPALLLSLALAACAGDEHATGLGADDLEPRLAVIPACVEFGPPPPVGALFGAPVATPPGAVVFVENGVRVSVHNFFHPGGPVSFNWARIEAAPAGFGAGQVIRSNNINIGFDYAGVGFVPRTIKFAWRDLGGHENLIVNGAGPFIGELNAPPAFLGGVAVASASGAIPGGDQGTTTLSGGAVGRFQVGGQEFWIDRVCAWP